jgi:hypothetical protein
LGAPEGPVAPLTHMAHGIRKYGVSAGAFQNLINSESMRAIII